MAKSKKTTGVFVPGFGMSYDEFNLFSPEELKKMEEELRQKVKDDPEYFVKKKKTTKKKPKVRKAAKGGMMKKKGYAKGGAMKKKGYAKGGAMKKKGYAMGGMMPTQERKINPTTGMAMKKGGMAKSRTGHMDFRKGGLFYGGGMARKK
tara:strand:- start:280 stop:726 length:447 start_codon:yes stop_codon:yes gene_type:complete